MSLHDDILDPSRLYLRGTFDQQVNYILDQIRLKRAEVEGLVHLFADLQHVLGVAWPGCTVHPFGSIVTGLGIRTSDVDCYIELPIWEKYNDGKTVLKAKRLLSTQSQIFTELFAIPKAKVPIVKFFHVPTQRHCDINFKSPAGVENSKLIAYLLHLDNKALQLAILIKYWSKMYNLTGTNLVPNYGLILLVVFYLQQKQMLPPVRLLQTVEVFKDIWNTGFQPIFHHQTNNFETLFELLGGFFEYYSRFDFESHIISPYMGHTIKRDLFKDLKCVPKEYFLYKENIRQGYCTPLNVDSFICLQDPFEHSRNCSVAVFPKLANKLVSCFKAAAKMFNEDTSSNFLRQIMTKIKVPDVPPQKKKQHAHNREVPTTSRNNALHGITKPKHNNIRQKLNKTKVHALFEAYSNVKKTHR